MRDVYSSYTNDSLVSMKILIISYSALMYIVGNKWQISMS